VQASTDSGRASTVDCLDEDYPELASDEVLHVGRSRQRARAVGIVLVLDQQLIRATISAKQQQGRDRTSWYPHV
jgi:hypothetical protein